jgi:uncharacterized protein with PIN domain
MLGSLARWLRLFGFDTVYLEPGPPDEMLAERARSEGRWLLTRDRELASVGPKTMLVRSSGLEDQMCEVLSRLGVVPESSLDSARCAECNGELHEASKEQVEGLAPPYVMATAPRFKRCASCGRVYWPGTHGDGILERLENVVERLTDPS